MTWQNGRELQSITKNNTTYSFKYNLSGLRTEKNIGETKTYYYYDSNNNLIGMKKGADTVLYYYDSDGGLVSMFVGGSSYLFVKNLQGDVTKIVDDSGDVVATYAYDAWGKILAETEDSSIAGLNPFRYRGYVYDPETELYYLQSRYYDPLTGRFLNADSPDYTDTGSGSPLSTNMFAYCENNPISGYDPSGHWKKSAHNSLCNLEGYKFTTLTRSWALIPDICFPSRYNHSAPFHARGLKVIKSLYNAAAELKFSAKTKSTKVKICYGKKGEEGFNKNKTKYFIPAEYIQYVRFIKTKKGKKINIQYKYSGSINIINYLNGGEISSDDYKELISYKLKKYQVTNRKEQAQALLGLSLHALQDYFAHLTTIEYKNKKNKWEKTTTTRFNNSRIPKVHKADFEDSKSIMSWRFKNAKKATKNLYNLYYGKNNGNKVQRIKSIYKHYIGKKEMFEFKYKKIYKYKIRAKEYTINMKGETIK